MSRRYRRWFAGLPLALFVCAGAALAQQGTGSVTGVVTDSAGHAGIADVQISITAVGAATTGPGARGTRTAPGGRFTVGGVPAGSVVVHARLIGYQPVDRAVTVQAGQPTTVDITLVAQTAMLDQIVVTGTPGATQRRAIGNVVESINATDVMAVAPVVNIDQMIGARTPGLIVLPPGGQVGTGAQLRVRGASSLSLTNDPIVYIDGVRMDASTSRGTTQRGGLGVSRLDDIDPEDIESVEVIKGPAAGTLYGTEASNGVIQIITKRGKSGKPQWSFTTRQGTNWMENPEGRVGYTYAKNASGGLDSVNIYQHEEEFGKGPVFHNGPTQGYTLNLSGGTDAARYYTSANYDNDVGVIPWNTSEKLGGRANADLLIGNTLRLATDIGYIRNRTRLAQGGIDIDPFSALVWATPTTLTKTQRGFYTSGPDEWPTVQNWANADRTTATLTTTYTPWSWFTNRLVTGIDGTSENNWLLYPRQPLGNVDPLGANGLGTKTVQRVLHNFITLDYAGSAKTHRGEDWDLTTSVGLQYYHTDISTIGATASNFPAIPITTITGGSTRSSTEDYSANATVGVFGQQEIAWRNRLFLTAALRGDDNSSFGKKFKAAYYPKFSGAWVLSEEPWFHVPGINTFRLRAALGAAGTQPGTFDAAQLYNPAVGYKDQPALTPGSLGNPELRPERSKELEAGFEATVFGGSTDLTYSHYSRKITDAIVNDPIPPSTGFPGSTVVNIGRVSGWGDEFSLNTRLVTRRNFAWEFGTQLANNGNRIDDMGGIPFITIAGGQAQNRVGFGIGDIFMYKVRAATIDATGKVLTATCDGGTGKLGLEQGGADTPCGTAPRVLWGHSQPTWQIGFNTSVTLWQNLRLYARVDGNGGDYQSDTEIRAIHNLGESKASILLNDPILNEYRAIDADAAGTFDASFLRLRELSASYTLSPRLTNRIGARNASINVAMRNIAMLWTGANGWNTARDGEVFVPIAGMHAWDPEVRAAGQLSQGYQTILPPTASFIATLRLSF
jgi:TonB-linked SusC/RagA family outer membrane protein